MLHTYEPADLDDMTTREALDAVLADLLDYPLTTPSDSLFTVLRHIDLLCHLIARAAGDAQFGLAYEAVVFPRVTGAFPLVRCRCGVSAAGTGVVSSL
ncbi:hypothetical protein ACF08A_33675, partial [Streptomyces cellulosae]